MHPLNLDVSTTTLLHSKTPLISKKVYATNARTLQRGALPPPRCPTRKGVQFAILYDSTAAVFVGVCVCVYVLQICSTIYLCSCFSPTLIITNHHYHQSSLSPIIIIITNHQPSLSPSLIITNITALVTGKAFGRNGEGQ